MAEEMLLSKEKEEIVEEKGAKAELEENKAVLGQEDAEEVDLAAEEDAELDSKFPFPRATITNLVRKNVSKGKQIKGTVKDEMNLWIASLIEKVTKKMDSQPYTFVNYEMLKEAIAPYESIQDINAQRVDLLEKISAIRKNCDEVVNKIDSDSKSKAASLKLDVEKLPFPKATITNKIRSNLSDGKTIKGPVKKGLNVWLGGIVERVSKKMDSYPYPYIDRSMFKEAIEPYDAIAEIELEKERIIQEMQSIKTACDILSLEVGRKFKV